MKRMDQSDIPDLLARMSQRYDVYAPQDLGETTRVFAPLGEGDLALSGALPRVGPKEVLFPSSEQLFSYHDDQLDDTRQGSDRPVGLFGLSAADAAGIAYLDQFFTKGYADDVYLQRRQDALISTYVGEDGEGGIEPAAGAGFFDLQFASIGKDVYVWPGSLNGVSTLERCDGFFDPVENDREIFEYLSERSSVPETLERIGQAAVLLRAGRVAEDFWDWVSDRCIACGGCSYVCPTCTCFDVWDRGANGKGARFRSWDSCILAGFSREGSRHNPRGSRSQRNRRRIEHKLMWDGPGSTGLACVGCGRCEAVCPSSMGMPTFATKILEQADARGRTILSALERAHEEPRFMTRLAEGDGGALDGYDLTPLEKAAVQSGDLAWLERYVTKLDGKQKTWIMARLNQEDWGFPMHQENEETELVESEPVASPYSPAVDAVAWSPEWLMGDVTRATTDALVVLERASCDMLFSTALLERGAAALEGYRLTDEEQAAILSGDIRWLEDRFGPLEEDQKEWLYRRLEIEVW